MDSSAMLTDLPLSRSNTSFASTSSTSLFPPSIRSTLPSSRSSLSCAKSGDSGVAGCDETVQDSSKSTNTMTTTSFDSAGTTLPPIAISGTLTPPDLPDGSTLRIITVQVPSSSTDTTLSTVHSITESIATLTVFVSTSIEPTTSKISSSWTASVIESVKHSSSSTTVAPTPITKTTLATTARTTTTTTSHSIATIVSTSTTPSDTFSALSSTLSHMPPLTTSFVSVHPAPPSSVSATESNNTPYPATSFTSTAPFTSQTPTLGSTAVHTQSHTVMIIALPVALGLAALGLALLFLWRRFAPTSFHKAQGKIPGYAQFKHWKDRRKRESRTRSLRTMEALSHSESGYSGYHGYNGFHAEFAGGDTFARRLRQYEQESMRAREKFSFEAPATPLSGGIKKTTGGGVGGNSSPWYKGKGTATTAAAAAAPTTPKRSVESLKTVTPGGAGVGGGESSAAAAGRRMFGPFKKEFNEETGSLESWEEKWFSLGNERESGGDFEMKSMKKPFEGHAERVAGPGMSWRKLV